MFNEEILIETIDMAAEIAREGGDKFSFTDRYLECYATAVILNVQVHLVILDEQDVPLDRMVFCKEHEDMLPIVIQHCSSTAVIPTSYNPNDFNSNEEESPDDEQEIDQDIDQENEQEEWLDEDEDDLIVYSQEEAASDLSGCDPLLPSGSKLSVPFATWDLNTTQSNGSDLNVSQSLILVPDFSDETPKFVEIVNFEDIYIRQVYEDQNGNEQEYFIVEKAA